jgi:uncharacterized NAD(P)/FAD-binding protein YdhS
LAIMENSWKVLIVGGGASGIFSAIALERFGIDASQIDIAEPRELLGEGLAYQTRDLHHRLNVPTGRMSSLEEFPDDFVEWSNAASYSFMQRRTYSGYLRERLGQGHNHIRACVTDLESESDGVVRATFDTGETNDYVAVVLAMGHGKALIPDFLRGVPESSRIIKDVWDGISLPESQTIICFGTGLSFVDIALTHLSRDTRNKVIAISGSGNLPERHVQFQITPFTPTVKEVATLAKLRTYFLGAGDKWREAVDGLRPIMDTVWRGFTMAEREEFSRTDGSTWYRRRHRIAPDVADRVDAEIALGRITVVKGRVAGVEVKDEQVTISLGDGSSYSGDYLAITIGRDYELSDPLTLNLLKAGKTSRGPLGMGLSVDVATGLLQRTDGTPYLQIFAIGPLRSGQAFETTAIPEIRKQATAIAERIVVNSYGLKV